MTRLLWIVIVLVMSLFALASGLAQADVPSAARTGSQTGARAGATAPVPTAPGGPPAPVFCGSYTCFQFRVTAVGKDPSTRASFAIDVINKFLGGAVGKFSTQPAGKNVRLLLNNELMAVITPADAAAEHQKTPVLLADKWRKLLTIAFDASKAQR